MSEKTKLTPTPGNGAEFENYNWSQTLSEVTVYVKVPEGIRARDVVVETKRDFLSVGLKGHDPIVKGKLCKPIKVNDSFWQLGIQM